MVLKKIQRPMALAGIVAAGVLAWWVQSPKSGDSAGPQGARAVGVEVAKVQSMSLRDDAEAVGSLRSIQNVMLRPEVAGRVLGIGFADGAKVRAGQMLVQMDDTLQRAEVQQSLAQVAVARANHKRNMDLVAQKFIAQRAADESAAALQVAEAQLGLSCARLDRMRLIAPFNGVVGIRAINVGDYVKDGVDLVNLENISSLYVDFRLPERFQAKIQAGQMLEVRLDAFAGRLFKAKVQAIDPLIDANGRSIAVRALLANGPGEPIAAPGKAASAPASAASTASSSPLAAPSKPAQSASSSAADVAKPIGMVNLPSAQSMGCPPNVFDRTRTQAGGEQMGPLRPGMFARVTAVFAVKPNAMVVPEEAVVPQGGKQFVIRVLSPQDYLQALAASAASAASGNASAASVAASNPASAPSWPAETQWVSQRVEVKLGIRRAGQVEVLSGLEVGDTVVAAGQQRLQKDGTPVRVVELGRGPAGAASAAASGAVGAASVTASAGGTAASGASR